GLEGFDLRLLDFGQRQLGPRPVVEKLLIAFPVKLDRPLLFRLGGSDPLIKRGLKLAERRNVLAQFFGGKGSWQRLRFFESSRLAKDARPRRRRDRFRLAPVFRARRTIVFPASVLELVGVVRASGSLEYFHQPAARRVFEVTNWRMVSADHDSGADFHVVDPTGLNPVAQGLHGNAQEMGSPRHVEEEVAGAE